MLSTIFSGVLLGLGLAVLIGPAFFNLLQTSINKGFKAAIILSLGVFFCDVFVVTLIFLGAKSILDIPIVSLLLGLIGGMVICIYGIVMFRKKNSNNEEYIKKKEEYSKHLDEFASTVVKEENIDKMVKKDSLGYANTTFLFYFFKGFVLNIANPGVWFYWLLWVGVISSTYTVNGNLNVLHVIIFLAAALCTVYATDVLKALTAHKLKNFMTDKFLNRLNKIFGIILLTFGVFLIVKTAYPYMLEHLPFFNHFVEWVKGLF
ncbi:MAG: LysE family translocator [Bacteroidales bacterium]|jgi:threonine/homoserine/homoserine lactone efflux protein|nr:LysE family translocator [Bacteroidales bacterium]